MGNSVIEAYRAKIADGDIDPDPAQRLAAEALNLLSLRLVGEQAARGGWFSSLSRRKTPPIKGLYMYGRVGRGKTMLMDLFHRNVRYESKQRAHFHEFMRDTHEAIDAARRQASHDPIPVVAQQILQRGRLISFDEFHVTDIADAMLLGRLFEQFWQNGAVVVATSNVAPRDLYHNGLNRQLFLPFVDLLEEHMDVLHLDAVKDYRLERLATSTRYFTPLGKAATAGMRRLWSQLTGVANGLEGKIEVLGRKVAVPEQHDGAAYFSFHDLFSRALGANDFLKIAETYHTVFIADVPIIDSTKRNEARRFITFVDALYDQGVRLVVAADGEPHELYPSGDEAFLFERTVSRLNEMRSDDYLARTGKPTS